MCILLSYYSKIYEITADFVCLPPGEACRCIWLILPEPDSLGGFFLLKGNFFLPTFAKCLLLVRHPADGPSRAQGRVYSHIFGTALI